MVVANDGLSVVVNQNTWAKCLTVAQLKTMWAPESEGKIKNWNQVDKSFRMCRWPFSALARFRHVRLLPEAINGEEGASRTDYSPSEDDNVTIQGVKGDKGAVGYFGLSYVEQNPDAVKASRSTAAVAA